MKTTEVIKELCARDNISIAELEKRLRFGNGSLTKNSYLRSDRLFSVSNFFGVSMEYLLTGHEKVTKSFPLSKGYDITPFEYELVEAYRAHPEHQTSINALLGIEKKERGIDTA